MLSDLDETISERCLFLTVLSVVVEVWRFIFVCG